MKIKVKKVDYNEISSFPERYLWKRRFDEDRKIHENIGPAHLIDYLEECKDKISERGFCYTYCGQAAMTNGSSVYIGTFDEAAKSGIKICKECRIIMKLQLD